MLEWSQCNFSDASELAYYAVVYIRVIDSSQVTHVSLVMAKSKVAPMKRLTVPRLELCGANLLANLLHTMSRSHSTFRLVTSMRGPTSPLSWAGCLVILVVLKHLSGIASPTPWS